MNSIFVIIFLISTVGLIVGIINPSFIEKILKNSKFTRKKAVINFGSLVVLSLILVSITSPSTRDEKQTTATSIPTTETPKEQPKPIESKKDTSELNASIRKVSTQPAGIEVTNNESSKWFGCKFVLNDSYKMQYNDDQGIGSGKDEALTIPYTLFTKSDGTRFNFTTIAPTSFLIECKVDGNLRENVYTFQ